MAIIDLKPKIGAFKGNPARKIAIHRMIPNMITLMAMAAGLASIQFALDMQWEKAVVAILIAAALDAIDGATARLLKATSDFGAQLDSLSDYLAFGIAPALILYAWILEESGRIGWIAMIFYASATALRLARFNVMRGKTPKWQDGFFLGVPSPAGAGLVLLPVFLWMQYPGFFQQFSFISPLVGLWVITVAGLMVSRIPTFSVKAMRIPQRHGMPILAGTALLIAAMITMPWPTLSILALAYLGSIPFAVKKFRRLEKENAPDGDDVEEI